MIVYADVLVALNVLLTYILLVAARVISRLPSKKYSIGIASLVGGFSALIIFAQGMTSFGWILYKLFSGAVICAVGFLPRSIKAFLKGFFSFFGVSCLFGGIVYAIEITVNPGNIYYCNGTVYFDMSITYLVGSVFAIYGVFLFADYFLRRKISKDNLCEIEIYFRDKRVRLKTLVDTGSNIADGTFGRPVAVVDINSTAGLFDYDELRFFKNTDVENIPQTLEGKVRVIPCKTVTGKGLLTAFIPDKMIIILKDGVYRVDFLAVAVAEGKISAGEYSGIIGHNMFDNAEKEKVYECIK